MGHVLARRVGCNLSDLGNLVSGGELELLAELLQALLGFGSHLSSSGFC